MESIIVSVIMPVYNVEVYLEDTMKDVLNQTLSEIEIICVDDGSTDHSLDILKRLQEQDERIIVLSQQKEKMPHGEMN